MSFSRDAMRGNLVKTFTYKNSVIIKAPLSRVFEASLNYPYFVSAYSFKKGTVENRTIKVEVGTRYLFFETRWTGTGLISEKMIEYSQTSGLLKGLISKWIFVEDGQQTRVIIDIEFKRNFFLGHIFLPKLSKIVQTILSDLDHYVSSKPKI